MLATISKKITAAAAALAFSFMTGCTGVNLSVESLLAAPKLTEEQSLIHEALISAVGRNITLKYPRSGSNRSAYVIANVDSEPTEEALVFYEYTGAENEGVRVNLLDRRDDGSWYSVKELAGIGTEVDKVVISSMGSSRQSILVGYQGVTGDNTLEIYTYSSDGFQRIGSDSYSLLEAVDINSDGLEELVTIQRTEDPDTSAVTAKAFLLRIENDEIIKDDGIVMCSGIVSYPYAHTGRLSNGDPAVYVDGVTADGQLITEIIYYRYSALQDPMQLRSEKLLPQCIRPIGYTCADIDGDNVYEIPSVKPMLGYEDAVTEEQVMQTTWCVYQDFYTLAPKLSGYYSVADGYTIAFPSRWNDMVTVKTDTETGETVFYKYEGNINADMQELMRVKAVTREESEQFLHDGYHLIETVGQLDYIVKLPTNKREPLILTIDEVKNSFYAAGTNT